MNGRGNELRNNFADQLEVQSFSCFCSDATNQAAKVVRCRSVSTLTSVQWNTRIWKILLNGQERGQPATIAHTREILILVTINTSIMNLFWSLKLTRLDRATLNKNYPTTVDCFGLHGVFECFVYLQRRHRRFLVVFHWITPLMLIWCLVRCPFYEHKLYFLFVYSNFFDFFSRT